MTFDLGRVTTAKKQSQLDASNIVVTFDLGRVTTCSFYRTVKCATIVVTFDLGRVTTKDLSDRITQENCGDVRSRTSYNVEYKFTLCGVKLW